jgi:DNA-binding SARP family transcriptional activator
VAETNARFALNTLGGLSLNAPDGKQVGASSRKPLAVLAVAAHAGDKGVSRRELIALLWPDLVRSKANHSLSQTLYALRRDLGDSALTIGENVTLNPAVVAWDVAEFRKHSNAGAVTEALNCYRGAFLDGVSFNECDDFDQWTRSIGAELASEHSALLGQQDRRMPARKLRGRVVAAVAALLVVAVAVAGWSALVAEASQGEKGFMDESLERQVKLLEERARGPRGRILVETPIQRAKRPDLDTLASEWRDRIESQIRFTNVADLVPRDSVEVIEREVAQSGYVSSAGKLRRANAWISLVSVVTSNGDSVTLRVFFQRLRLRSSAAEIAWDAAYRERMRLPPRPVTEGPRTESTSSRMVTAHRDSIGRLILRLALDVTRAIDEMRTCDRVATGESLPWCWQSNNVVTTVRRTAAGAK